MKLIFNFGFIIIMVSLFFGCSLSGRQPPDYSKLARKITEKTAKQLEEQKSLYLVGTGGQMMHDIQMMAMSFYFYREVSLPEARNLIAYAINAYLAQINDNKEIRPYLHEYPFIAKNVEIRIWIHKPDGTHPTSDKIYYISAINGVLDYYIRGAKRYSRQAICEETYEEALQAISSK